MGMRDKIAKADIAGEQGQYLGPGNHIGVIEALKEIETPNNGDAVVLEVRLTDTDAEDHKVDEVRTVMWMIDKHKSAAGQFKRAVADILECEEEEITTDLLGELFDDKSLDGAEIAIRSFNVKTKENNDFTKHSFSKA